MYEYMKARMYKINTIYQYDRVYLCASIFLYNFVRHIEDIRLTDQ